MLLRASFFFLPAGLHNHNLLEPVLERRKTGLLAKPGRQHDSDGRLRREDLGSRHVLRKRQTLVLTRCHRKEQNASATRRRVDRLWHEASTIDIIKHV